MIAVCAAGNIVMSDFFLSLSRKSAFTKPWIELSDQAFLMNYDKKAFASLPSDNRVNSRMPERRQNTSHKPSGYL